MAKQSVQAIWMNVAVSNDDRISSSSYSWQLCNSEIAGHLAHLTLHLRQIGTVRTMIRELIG